MKIIKLLPIFILISCATSNIKKINGSLESYDYVPIENLSDTFKNMLDRNKKVSKTQKNEILESLNKVLSENKSLKEKESKLKQYYIDRAFNDATYSELVGIRKELKKVYKKKHQIFYNASENIKKSLNLLKIDHVEFQRLRAMHNRDY